MAALAKAAAKWTAIALWLDLVDRLLSSPLDALFALSPVTAWLDGVTKCMQ